MSRHTDPFYTAKLAVTAAKVKIAELEPLIESVTKGSNFKPFTNDDRATGERVYKLRIVADIPDEAETLATDIITNLRGGLDKAMNAATKALGQSSPKYTNFPHAPDEKQLKGQLASDRGLFRDIPAELHPYIMGLRPYRGGNELLYAFMRRSNPAKHENILTLETRPAGLGISSNGVFNRLGFVWNEAKTELECLRTPLGHPFQGNMQIPFYITFSAAPPLGSKEFIPASNEIAEMVDGIIAGVEAETARLLCERQR